MKDSKFVYVNDVADFMEVDRKTVYRWIQAGVIPEPCRIGGKSYRWHTETIDTWIKSQKGLSHVNFEQHEQPSWRSENIGASLQHSSSIGDSVNEPPASAKGGEFPSGVDGWRIGTSI